MTELVGKRLGEFEVIRELGRGGMGLVFEAVQTSLNRRVALKVLGPGLGLTTKAISRFRREAESAAKLHHTNIVPVYATGEEAGLHFYAMELIDGPSLDRVIAELRASRSDAKPTKILAPELAATGPYLDTSTPTGTGVSSGLSSGSAYFDTVARLVADVAEALHHAHQNGVIHRDIKPSNLLLGSDGRLSVNDFGLARALEEPGMTTTGEFVGTPAYMAPEQIAGGRIPVDQRCDIYSLGATLYELLTLQPPFLAERRDQLLALVVQKEPPAPRRVNPKAPRDLETICLKCLEKDPDRRYANAKELADDLRRYVSRFAIAARRTGPLGKFRKWVRRNPWVSGLAAAVLVATSVAGYFAWQAHIAEVRRIEELRTTTLEKSQQLALGGYFAEAEQSLGEAERLGASVGDVRFVRGQIAYFRGDLGAAIDHLEEAAKWQPRRVAPRALLAAACMDFGAGERHYELLRELDTLTPETNEDYLFKGFVESYEKPEKGLPAMDKAIRERESLVARALRARARALAAMGTGNPADAERAVKDAEIAKDVLKDNPFALAQSVFAYLVAAGAYEQHSRPEKQREALAQARDDVKALERVRDLPVASLSRIWYFRETENYAAALAESLNRQRTGVPMSSLDEFLLAMGHYHNGNFQQAATLFDEVIERRLATRADAAIPQVSRCLVLAELPNGRDRALAEYKRLKLSGLYKIYAPTVLLQAGHKTDAVRAYLLIKDEVTVATRTAWLDRLLEYNAGLIKANDLLAVAGESRFNLCEAHFFIGLNLLADGDRVGARDQFRRSVGTHVIWFFDHSWSLAFLSRMEKDPDWPLWIKNPKSP